MSQPEHRRNRREISIDERIATHIEVGTPLGIWGAAGIVDLGIGKQGFG
jgi:hypothetical protein